MSTKDQLPPAFPAVIDPYDCPKLSADEFDVHKADLSGARLCLT